MRNEPKVLLFMDEKSLKPTGGPVGYLHNVKYAIDEYGVSNIDFLNQNQTLSSKRNLKFLLAKKLPKEVLDLKLMHNVYTEKKSGQIDFNDYDVVHFHNTFNLFLNRANLENFNGKVLLSSHSPKPAHVEIIEDQLKEYHMKLYPNIKGKLEEVDRYAFQRADHIVFPCEEAEEPYLNNWGEYTEIKHKKNDDYRYILTGTRPCKSRVDRRSIREKFNIPQEAFVICYVGRHNKTKGYDILKNIAEQVLDKYENIYFLIAGKEEPLTGLTHKRWIEVGWTNDPHSIISASNMFILPNRETYFDLIMLEVLSLGKIVLASNTGGNRFFGKINKGGIFIYNDESDAISQIESITSLSKAKLHELEISNTKLFEEHFTMKRFINNYVAMIKNICK